MLIESPFNYSQVVWRQNQGKWRAAVLSPECPWLVWTSSIWVIWVNNKPHTFSYIYFRLLQLIRHMFIWKCYQSNQLLIETNPPKSSTFHRSSIKSGYWILFFFFLLHYTCSQSTDTKYTILICGWDLKISEMKVSPSWDQCYMGTAFSNCLLWLKVRLRSWVGGKERERVAIVILYGGQRRKHRTLASLVTEKQGQHSPLMGHSYN